MLERQLRGLGAERGLLAGRTPFAGDGISELRENISNAPVPMADVAGQVPDIPWLRRCSTAAVAAQVGADDAIGARQAVDDVVVDMVIAPHAVQHHNRDACSPVMGRQCNIAGKNRMGCHRVDPWDA